MSSPPNRRPSFTEEVAGEGFTFAVTVGFDPVFGNPCEVFLTKRGKSGSELERTLYEIGVQASKMMQDKDRSHGIIENLLKEVSRLSGDTLEIVGTTKAPSNLFEPRPAARQTDVDTSHAAAESMIGAARQHRQLILGVMRNGGPRSAQQIADATSIDYVAVGKRMCELRRGDFVYRTDKKHRNRSGRPAYQYALTGSGWVVAGHPT